MNDREGQHKHQGTDSLSESVLLQDALCWYFDSTSKPHSAIAVSGRDSRAAGHAAVAAAGRMRDGSAGGSAHGPACGSHDPAWSPGPSTTSPSAGHAMTSLLSSAAPCPSACGPAPHSSCCQACQFPQTRRTCPCNQVTSIKMLVLQLIAMQSSLRRKVMLWAIQCNST